MAERFVSAPVSLTVKFPCSIRVKAIQIDNTVGSFSSSGFQILAYCLTPGDDPSDPPIPYVPVGRCFNVNPGIITFLNHRYGPGYSQETHPSDQTFPLTPLYNARYLIIRITRTLGGGIPVMKSLQIFGYPLSTSFFQLKRQVNINRNAQKFNIHENTQIPAADSPVDSAHASKDDDVPGDFIDALTYEIMSLPVILPSGYTVDQQTLDKHIEAENSWGRKPSDPFTGLSFSDSSRPIINHILKERIDRFALVENINIGRTTGWKRPHSSVVHSQETVACSVKIHKSTDFHIEANKPTNRLTTIDAPDGSADSGSQLSSRLSKVLSKASKLRTVELPPQPILPSCIKCTSSSTATNTALYSLKSCDHLICKSCLLSLSDSFPCTECNVWASKSELFRYHAK